MVDKLSKHIEELNYTLEMYKCIINKYPDTEMVSGMFWSKKVKRKFTHHLFNIISNYCFNDYMYLDIWNEIIYSNKIIKIYYKRLSLIEIKNNKFVFYSSSHVPKSIFQEYINYSIKFIKSHPDIKIDTMYLCPKLRKLLPFI